MWLSCNFQVCVWMCTLCNSKVHLGLGLVLHTPPLHRSALHTVAVKDQVGHLVAFILGGPCSPHPTPASHWCNYPELKRGWGEPCHDPWQISQVCVNTFTCLRLVKIIIESCYNTLIALTERVHTHFCLAGIIIDLLALTPSAAWLRWHPERLDYNMLYRLPLFLKAWLPRRNDCAHAQYNMRMLSITSSEYIQWDFNGVITRGYQVCILHESGSDMVTTRWLHELQMSEKIAWEWNVTPDILIVIFVPITHQLTTDNLLPTL
jgi:hypothetical protein